MKITKLQVFFLISLIFVSGFLFLQFKSGITRRIANDENLEICILNEEKSFVVKYDSLKRRVVIVKPSKKIKLSGTNFQKAYTLMTSIFQDNFREEKIYFVDISKTKFDESYFLDYISTWRIKIISLIEFFQKMMELKKNSNLSFFEISNIFIEISHLNPSSFFIEEAEIKKEENLDLKEDIKNDLGIKVEILNASSYKNMAFRVANYLQSQKVNVLNVSNTKIQTKTEIICNDKANIEKAETIRKILDIKSEIYVKKSKYRIFDVTLVIGEDFKSDKIGVIIKVNNVAQRL